MRERVYSLCTSRDDPVHDYHHHYETEMVVKRVEEEEGGGGGGGGIRRGTGVVELQGHIARLVLSGKLLVDYGVNAIKADVKKKPGNKAEKLGNVEEEEVNMAACVSMMALLAASRGQLVAHKCERNRCDILP